MTSAIPADRAENKLLGLEVLRFITAFAILVWHYQHFAYVGNAAVGLVRTHQPFYGVLRPFFEYGLNGVQVFWCISGFIFFHKYRDSLAERRVSGRTFFVLRFSRLYPLHLVTLLIVAGLQGLYARQHGFSFVYENNDLKHFILQLFMASYWGLQQGLSFNGPIWSISTEILVYFVFHACLRLFGRSNLVTLTMIGLFLLARMSGRDNALVNGLGFFYAGGLAAIFQARFTDHKAWFRMRLAVLICLLAGISAAAGLHGLWETEKVNLTLFWLTPLVLILVSGDLPALRPFAPIIEGFGNLTYASYLLHFPLQLSAVLIFAALKVSVPFYSDGLFLGYLAAVLALSWLVFRVFERPVQNAIRKAQLG
ncbi:MAG: acyltransferase [Phenylobacterium zucineum]|nr:MAG: acyltransferase [Phenylobacterium zucineum]